MPINKETILSVYEDKLTLMQWLKKVEDALKNDTLKDVELLQDGNNVAFKFVFEDSEIITDYIELQANGITAINYDSTTLQIVVTFTDGTTRVLGPLFDTQSDITVQDLNAKSVTTETVNADSISVDGDINSNGSITASDEVQSDDIVARNTLSSMERILDLNGNFRFVEGSGTPISQAGVNITYNKWSLSGTHLMFVAAGTISQGVTLYSNSSLISFELPDYIYNKINVLIGQRSIEIKNISFYNTSGLTLEAHEILLAKYDGNLIKFNIRSNFTTTEDRVFRIQFDLLIDAS